MLNVVGYDHFLICQEVLVLAIREVREIFLELTKYQWYVWIIFCFVN